MSFTSAASGGNLNWPRTPFIDQSTMMPSLPWLLWLQNPSVNSFSSANALGINSGGTGVTTTPTNGQLLIGNGSSYSLNTLTAGTAIGLTNGPGSITLNNLGVTSFSAGTTGFTPSTATTGAVTLGGILNLTNGGTGASTAAGARTNLGLGTIATQNANNVAITGGSIAGTTISTSPISGASASVTTLTTSSTITANNIATTGTHTTIAKWLPVVCDGTTYYIPLYT